jgi:hypothetical protein
MRLALSFFSALFCLILLNVPAMAQDKTSGTTLYGGVAHSDVLPHVDDALSKHRQVVKANPANAKVSETGKTMTPVSDPIAALTGMTTLQSGVSQEKRAYLPMTGVAQPTTDNNKVLSGQVQKYTAEWFMIPKWLAGKWAKAGDLTVSLTDLQSGQKSFPNEWVDNKMQANWGHQVDKAGNIWHVNILPSERDGQSAGKTVRFLTVVQKCEKTDESSLVTRTQYVVSEANFLTGQSIDMFQQESLNHYILTPQRDVVNVSTNRVFNYQGIPLRDGQLKSEYSRIAEFVTVPVLNGIDLKESLNEYLDSHGLTQLKTSDD